MVSDVYAEGEVQGIMTTDTTSDALAAMCDRLERIERMLADLVTAKTVKDWYSTDEVADVLGQAPYTVREWCRYRRVRAEKRASGSGKARPWMISHAELTRIRNEGILPLNAQG